MYISVNIKLDALMKNEDSSLQKKKKKNCLQKYFKRLSKKVNV